ncbi:hypothetical protein E2C01_051629 [Portunus trituberculatus]|uniref:Uncharacterized protein n=1 Tax=Portunus trituberculatus TaxID=210409 RepID=A0A5B7GMA7_PORTR|nr:hypothetical protein [Portunus trituberculatus]
MTRWFPRDDGGVVAGSGVSVLVGEGGVNGWLAGCVGLFWVHWRGGARQSGGAKMRTKENCMFNLTTGDMNGGKCVMVNSELTIYTEATMDGNTKEYSHEEHADWSTPPYCAKSF